jgi:hypothetical protein
LEVVCFLSLRKGVGRRANNGAGFKNGSRVRVQVAVFPLAPSQTRINTGRVQRVQVLTTLIHACKRVRFVDFEEIPGLKPTGRGI